MKLKIILLISLLCPLINGYCQDGKLIENHHPQITDFSGKKFSFAILADPQVNGKESKGEVGVKAAKTLEQACQEINNMNNMPLFTIFLGDLVNTFNETSVENFAYCIRDLKIKTGFGSWQP